MALLARGVDQPSCEGEAQGPFRTLVGDGPSQIRDRPHGDGRRPRLPPRPADGAMPASRTGRPGPTARGPRRGVGRRIPALGTGLNPTTALGTMEAVPSPGRGSRARSDRRPGQGIRHPSPTVLLEPSRVRPRANPPPRVGRGDLIRQSGKARSQRNPAVLASVNQLKGWFGCFKPRTYLTRGLKTEAGPSTSCT